MRGRTVVFEFGVINAAGQRHRRRPVFGFAPKPRFGPFRRCIHVTAAEIGLDAVFLVAGDDARGFKGWHILELGSGDRVDLDKFLACLR